jgi:hypothetical protein
MKTTIFALGLTLLISSCGYDGHYRYPCQNPDNWESAECTPPICHASDFCTKDLIPDDALNS